MKYRLNPIHWDWWDGSEDPSDFIVEESDIDRIVEGMDITREELLSDAEVVEEFIMKNGIVRIVDGQFIDQYALSMIDHTHLFMKRYTSFQEPSQEAVETGTVYHIAQLKGMATGLYEAVMDWMLCKRHLENVEFVA